MKRLYLYILKSFTGPFLFTLFVSVFVLLMSSIWRYIDKFAGRDLPFSVIVEFFAYYSVTTLFMAIPLAILLASIMTMGNFGERYELTAMKAAGISLMKVLRPLFIIAVVLGGLTFYISNYIAPISMFKSKSLLSDMLNKNPEFLLKEGEFIADMPGATIKVERLSKQKDGKFFDAIIYEKAPSGRLKRTITADSGKMVSSKDLTFMTIWLYNGKIYEENQLDIRYPFTRTSFDEYMVISPMKVSRLDRTEKDLNKQDYRMLTFRQLDTLIDKTKIDKSDEEQQIKKNLNNNKYFKIQIKKDTLAVATTLKSVNVDSILNSLPQEELNIVFSSAINAANDTKDYLKRSEDYFSGLRTYSAKTEAYWHQKFTWAFACIIFFLLGSSLGAIVRKGGFGLPVLISIVFFIAYYMLDKYGSNFFLAKGFLPAYISCWLATISFLILSLWLSYKATTDSAMMDSESYTRLLKKLKIMKLLGKVKKKLRKA